MDARPLSKNSRKMVSLLLCQFLSVIVIEATRHLEGLICKGTERVGIPKDEFIGFRIRKQRTSIVWVAK